jgi:hypothetical protein
LAELGGQEVAAALAGQPAGEAVLSIHVATDAEADAALQEAARAGGVVVKRAAPTPLGGPMGSMPTSTYIYEARMLMVWARIAALVGNCGHP